MKLNRHAGKGQRALSVEPNGATIREARTSDRDAIAALWLELIALHRQQDERFTLADNAERIYSRYAHDMIRSRDARVFVAQKQNDSALIGFIMGDIQNRPAYAQAGRYGFISDVFVREEWRHHGVGKALFERMHQWFVSRQADAIQLFVSDANPDALAFWESLGMTPFLRLYHLKL
jgi:diamine N-acetyltransferase